MKINRSCRYFITYGSFQNFACLSQIRSFHKEVGGKLLKFGLSDYRKEFPAQVVINKIDGLFIQ